MVPWLRPGFRVGGSGPQPSLTLLNRVTEGRLFGTGFTPEITLDRLEVEEPELYRTEQCGLPITHPELAIERTQLRLHGVHGDEEAPGELRARGGARELLGGRRVRER